MQQASTQQMYQQSYMAQQPPVEETKKSKKGLIAVIAVLSVALLTGGFFVVRALVKGGDKEIQNQVSEANASGTDVITTDGDKEISLPDITYTYLSYEPSVSASYTYTDIIYPRQYNRMESIMNLSLQALHGESKIRISVEIPGFTQAYTQTMTIGAQRAEIYIKPSLVAGDLGLRTAKNMQLSARVENLDTGDIILEETLPVKIMSENDINNYDPEWETSSLDVYLSFLTPEDAVVDEISRNAIEYLEYFTDNQLSAFAGYQYDDENATYYQVLATQVAISEMGVKYDSGSYSNSDADLYLQNVKLPREVISTKAGLCVETSLLLSSVLMNEGMHCFLLFPPGHCQVAVETNTNSGEYFLVETTTLPITNDNMDSVITYFDSVSMETYISTFYGEEVYVVDCDLADDLDFQYVEN